MRNPWRDLPGSTLRVLSRIAHRGPGSGVGRRKVAPRCLPGLLILALLLGLFLPPISKVQAGSADAPKAGEAQEADLDFSDLFYVRNPLPATDVEVGYRFERISGRTDAGSGLTHKNEVSLALSLAATEWLGLSVEMPYQFLSIRSTDGSSSTQVNNIGDFTVDPPLPDVERGLCFLRSIRDPTSGAALPQPRSSDWSGSRGGSFGDRRVSGGCKERRWAGVVRRALVEAAQTGDRAVVPPHLRS